ncbi:MAG: hypothetical protein M3O34_03900 [Chloroflexota bacterium]|nr:hypothetical protein [Chloroflexota bacterium]
MRNAYIGLGTMGGPMVANLLAAGHGDKDCSSIFLLQEARRGRGAPPLSGDPGVQHPCFGVRWSAAAGDRVAEQFIVTRWPR